MPFDKFQIRILQGMLRRGIESAEKLRPRVQAREKSLSIRRHPRQVDRTTSINGITNFRSPARNVLFFDSPESFPGFACETLGERLHELAGENLSRLVVCLMGVARTLKGRVHVLGKKINTAVPHFKAHRLVNESGKGTDRLAQESGPAGASLRLRDGEGFAAPRADPGKQVAKSRGNNTRLT